MANSNMVPFPRTNVVFLLIICSIILGLIATPAAAQVLISLTEPDNDLYSTFTVAYDAITLPAQIVISFATPGNSNFDSTPANGFCRLTFLGSSNPPQSISMYTGSLTSGMFENTDEITRLSGWIDLPAEAESASSIQCQYATGNHAFPAKIEVISQNLVVKDYFFVTGPRHFPHSIAGSFGAFAEIPESDPTQVKVHLSGLFPLRDSPIWSRIRFRITASSAFAFPTVVEPVGIDGSVISAPIPISTFDGFIEFTAPLPATIGSIVITLTFQSAPPASLGFNCEINSTLLMSNLDEIIPVTSLAKPPLEFIKVSMTNPANNRFQPGAEYPHKELTIEWAVRKQRAGSQTIYISPPARYRQSLFLTDCTLTGGADTVYNISPAANIYTVTTIIPDGSDGVALLQCTAIMSLNFAPPQPQPATSFWQIEYANFQLMSVSDQLVSTLVPWHVVRLNKSNNILQLSSISTADRPVDRITPTDFLRPDHQPSWNIKSMLPGMFAPSIPEVSLEGRQGRKDLINLECIITPKDFTYFGRNSLSPTMAIHTDLIPTLVSPYPGAQSMTPRPNEPSIMLNPTYDFDLTFTPHSQATVADPDIDTILFPPNTKLFLRFASGKVDFPINTSVLPLAHLPVLIIKSPSLVKKTPYFFQRDAAVDIVYTISPTALHHPSTEPTSLDSVWHTQPEVIIYPGTQFAVETACNGCLYFATRPFGVSFPTLPPHWTVDLVSGEREYTMITLTYGEDGTAQPLTISTPLDFPFTFSLPAAALRAAFGLEIIGTAFQFKNKGAVRQTVNQEYFEFTATDQLVRVGTTMIKFTGLMGGDQMIPRLMDSTLATQPVIVMEPGVALTAQFAPQANGFTKQSIELWYIDDSKQEVFVSVVTRDTPHTLTDLKFKGVTKVIQNAFLKLVYNFTPIDSFTVSRNTALFDIFPGCIKQAAEKKYESSCVGPNETCSMTAGVCFTPIPSPTATISEEEVSATLAKKCPRCLTASTKSCTPPDLFKNKFEQCTCKDQWEGPTCALSTSCNSGTKPKCNLSNGFPSLSTDGQCSSTCQCYNQWSGQFCQSCTLQCLNNGIAYSDCARCGCPKGFRGDNCQCNSVQGQLTLAAHNDLIQLSRGRLSTEASSSSTELFHFDHNHLIGNFVFPNGSTQTDFELIFILSELYESFQLPLTNNIDGKFTFSVTPQGSTADQTTQFNFTIPFNCNQYNPNLTSLDQVKELWASFVDQLLDNPTVQKYFTVSLSTPPPTRNNLVEVSDDFPPEGERLINAAFGFGSVWITLLAVGSFVVLTTSALL